ncbi:MAG: dihydrolipoyl dehydrogenase [Candidatus Aenigmarchaeota archaeon]|nr:dihydrolipoyl dehydrogenase [Candidatus Aenigmarchaeota archaeon]
MPYKYDVIVIGGGSGLIISSQASAAGMKVALIEEGPLGGTCLNRGCIPSKALIHSAEIAETVRNAGRFGINAKVASVNFPLIMRRMRDVVKDGNHPLEKGIREDGNITLYTKRAKFIGERELWVGGKWTITADKIVIAAGARPSVPQIEGLGKARYLDSTSVFSLKKQPESIAIIGGGYIASEFAHFFHSIGTKVTVIQRNKYLVPDEDAEVRELFTRVVAKKMNVLLEHNTVKVARQGRKKVLYVKHKSGRGPTKRIMADEILVATGRTPNTDLLNVQASGVETNDAGFIKVDDYLQTSHPGIWAFGDIIGREMFKHTANYEAFLVWNNMSGEKKVKVNFSANPHAVFTSPQIAGVGLTEERAKEEGYDFEVMKYPYGRTGKGAAIGYPVGFAKAIVEKKTERILGFHIIGPQAADIIHEVIVAMNSGMGTFDPILRTIHIHPTLAELIPRVFGEGGE